MKKKRLRNSKKLRRRRCCITSYFLASLISIARKGHLKVDMEDFFYSLEFCIWKCLFCKGNLPSACILNKYIWENNKNMPTNKIKLMFDFVRWYIILNKRRIQKGNHIIFWMCKNIFCFCLFSMISKLNRKYSSFK